MKYGDEDGFNKTYDENGELTLHPEENVLVKEENVVPSLKSTWRYYGGDYLLEPSKGTIYLTNERLVFINIPERMYAIGGGGEKSRAMSSSMKSSFELGNVSPGATMREYFEIPNIEIMASERKEGAVSRGIMVNVYVLSSGNQYHLSMVLEEESDLLERLMNKRVDSLDQLVNNLKDYFQKTDWMFTEPEKRIMKKKDENPEKAPQISEGRERPSREKKRVTPTDTPGPKPTVTPPSRINVRSAPKPQAKSNTINYFKNLFEKGLITEKIYRKLLEKHGAPKDNGPGSTDIRFGTRSDEKLTNERISDHEVQTEENDEIKQAEPFDEEDGNLTEDMKKGDLDEDQNEDRKLLEMIDSTLEGVTNTPPKPQETGNEDSASPESKEDENPPPDDHDDRRDDVVARKVKKLKIKDS